MNRPSSPLLYGLLVIVYFSFISFISHIPGEQLQRVDVQIWDKLAHVLLYMPLGFIFALMLRARDMEKATPSPKHAVNRAWRIGFAVLFFAGLATIDECHQYFVPSRTASFLDGVADVVGGLLGMLCEKLRHDRFRSRDLPGS